MEKNKNASFTLDTIYNEDCMVGLNRIPNNSVDLVLTDIPYGEVNRANSGIRNLYKGDADIVNFDLVELTQTLCDKTKGSIYMFCGFEQVSEIIKTMKEKGLSTRIITWKKTNPSPMNGQNLWLSATELCVYGKKKGAIFNGHCKSNVLHYPTQRGKIHPTMKPVKLFEELITTSSNEGDIVLDAFMGSGTTAIACMNTNRRYVGFELNKSYFDSAKNRIYNNYPIAKEHNIDNKNIENMKKNIIEKVMANHSGLGEFVNGMEFVKEVHSLYKNLGGMKNYQMAKGIIKYVANENELGWNYVVQFISYLIEQIDKKGITSCKENIDWEQACIKCFPKELELVKTKSAFKDFFYLVSLNKNEDADALLAESTLSAYGWHLIVKNLVALYEELLSTNTEYAEYLLPKDDTPSIKDECPTTAPKVETTPTVTELSEKKSTITLHKKYARGRAILLVDPDGKETEWANAKAIETTIGIPEGAIRKNVSGNSKFIRYNHKKYIASYKEAC